MTKNWFSRPIIALCRSEVLQNAPREHSAILLAFIKLPFVFKTFVLSVLELPLKTSFTVLYLKQFITKKSPKFPIHYRECSGSVVECLTGDGRAKGSSLTGVTVLCP